MSRTAALPLNGAAVDKSDDDFYANHPELVQNGERIPLDPIDPKQAKLRTEWMDLYIANGGKLATKAPTKKKPEDTSHTCPPCKDGQGQLVIKVVDQNGNPVPDATVTASATGSVLSQKTDQQGIADFGVVNADTYDIAATKDRYYPWGQPGSPAQAFEDTVEVDSHEKATASLGLQPCVTRRLKSKPFLVGKGAESLTGPFQNISIPGSTGGVLNLTFGQDTTHGVGGKPVTGYFLPQTEAELQTTMRKLLDVFAQNDTDGKAKREFDAFLAKKNTVTVYTDPKLDNAVEIDENFKTYPDRVLAAPGSPFANPPKPRVHQALESAGWDINSVKPITDLGVPAFNAGDKYPFKDTGDWANGLAVMIDSVEYIFVFVDDYEYDSCKEQYTISFIFELYDIFGLDDEDIKQYGATGSILDTTPQEGITAWWQLQHQFDYAPLITKVVVKKSFTISTK